MHVVFFGSSAYCLPVLESLRRNFDLISVVTREDKPAGRKQILTPSPVKVWAQEHEIPLGYLNADLAIVADYGQIIPEKILNKPKLGTFNIHFSKLPEFRGASPVQATLLKGDKTAWITIFKLEKTLDTGPILWQKEYPVMPDDTAGSLYARLFEEVAKELPGVMSRIGHTNLIPQDHSKATYTKLLTKQDGFVEWKDLEKPETYNRFRAMTPWPGLWTLRQAQGKLQRMKILKCHPEGNKLILDEIQYEGKKSQAV